MVKLKAHTIQPTENDMKMTLICMICFILQKTSFVKSIEQQVKENDAHFVAKTVHINPLDRMTRTTDASFIITISLFVFMFAAIKVCYA